jgi:predicted metal-dependent hydrolase
MVPDLEIRSGRVSKPGDGADDPRYAGFFACFNRGEYFEAHEVLENLWLGLRRSPIGDFYKGLIQLAGAFVHVRKGRREPAISLLKLARRNLAKYGASHEALDICATLHLIEHWRRQLEGDCLPHLDHANRPQVHLMKK